MAFFRARRTLSSSLLRAFSSPSSSSSSFSSFSSSYSSIASRSRFAFPILTEQTPPFPPSIDSSFRFLSTESSKSEEDESSEKSVEESLDSLAEESSEKSVEESLDLVVDEAFIAAVEKSMKNANLSPLTEEETVNSAEEEKPADSSVEEESAESKDGENAPPKKKTVFLEGCDLEHWLIIMEFPKEQPPSEESMVNTYVKTLATVLECSEEEAKTKIYSVSFVPYTGFGAQISEELSQKVKEQPGVNWVLPDSYIDIVNKDYGGDLYENGKVIPREKYRTIHKRSQQQNNANENNGRPNNARPNNDRREGREQYPQRHQNRNQNSRPRR